MEATAVARKSLVWIDNAVEGFGPLIDQFRKILHFDVRTAAALGKGLDLLNEQAADYVFLDYVIDSEGGLSVLDRILDRSLAKRVYLCSGYSYDERIAREIEKSVGSDSRVGFIPKEKLPYADESEDLERFDQRLRDGEFLTAEGINLGRAVSAVDAKRAVEYFPSWADYTELDLIGRISLLNIAASRTAQVRQEYIARGARAILFCGSWETPVDVYENDAVIPPEHWLVQEGHRRGYAPFFFSFSGPVDDISGGCQPSRGMETYPFVELYFRGTHEEVHFDTGNDKSLLAYEWFLEKGWIEPTVVPEMHFAGELEFLGKNVMLPGAICTDSSGSAVAVERLTGFAAMNWSSYRVAVPCVNPCEAGSTYPNSQYRLCKRRCGLLGRAFLRELGKKVTLDSEEAGLRFG